jgi:DNA gyrase subunit A
LTSEEKNDEAVGSAKDAVDPEVPEDPGDVPGAEMGYSDNLKPKPIEEELKKSFIDYSMSVIVSRAIPDVRDGLKPVQRRILYAMRDMGITHQSAYRKSARVVGEVLGKYHPHGDSAVYEAMVRMAQKFSLRYPLVDGQGNFGSVDGDRAAAMRYTEARLAKITQEMLESIDKETVDFRLNFDDSLEEPSVLPGKLPNLLINGASGIAVGMATNIPPHNLSEICDAIVALIDQPESSVLDLMEHVKGPDFPTGGIIGGTSGIHSAFLTGRGRIVVRAHTEIEERPGDKQAIIVTELPYQVNKANLLVSIAQLVKEKKIEGITDLRDESDRHGMRMVIELKRGTVADVILNQLYAHTYLQTTFGVLNLSLVDDRPKILDLKQTLEAYIKHREEMVRRATEYDLKKAEEKLHVLKGLLIALAEIEAVIELIRSSKDPDAARTGLMERFELSEIQAKAILDMRLARLTSLEVEQVQRDHDETLEFIRWCQKILADRAERMRIIREQVLELKEKYGDERRTEIIEMETDFLDEELIPREDALVVMTRDGYTKRMGLDTYRAQHRGGKGLRGMKVKEEDQVVHLFKAHSHDWVLFFTDKGKLHWLKTYKIPVGGRYSRGKAIVNLLEGLEPDERIMTCIPTQDFPEEAYLVFATKQGKIKRTALSAYRNVRTSGIKAIRLEEGDELISVRVTHGEGIVMLATGNGQACTFRETDVRPMGRDTAGVRGIKLRKGDEVVSLAAFPMTEMVAGEEDDAPEAQEAPDEVADESEDTEGARAIAGQGPYVLTLTENGFGKIVHLKEYRLTNRGGLGVRTLNVTKKSGRLVAVRSVEGDEHVLLSSLLGMVVRVPMRQIRLTKSRAATGVIVMRMQPDDQLRAVAVLPPESVVEDDGEPDEPGPEAPDEAGEVAEQASATGTAEAPGTSG